MTDSVVQKPIAREEEFDFLYSIIGKNVPASTCIVLSGPPGCGKTSLARSVLLNLSKDSDSFRSIDVSCLEVCPSKTTGSTLSRNSMLFDLILCEIKEQFLPSFLQNALKCESAAAFVENISYMFHKMSGAERQSGSFCIVLHQAEKLRDMPDNILPVIVNLDSLVREYMRIHSPNITAPNIVTLLLTSCTWDKFYTGTFASEPICLYLKSYNREELAKILISASPVNSPRYARFVNILLTVCLPVTRNVKELLFLAQFNWRAFDEPVVQGLVAPDDEWGQYRHALPTLKRSLSTIYLQPEHETADTADPSLLQRASTNASHFIELPLYPRYILIAAYIASYNPKSADKRFLVKNTGKMSSRSKRHAKKVEYTNNHLRGPRLFPIDRLIAIFYALLSLEGGEEENTRLPPLSSKLIGTVGALCGLGLLAPASSALAAGSSSCVGGLAMLDASMIQCGRHDDDPLFNPRYRCLINLETARAIAKSIDIDLNRYLLDLYE